MTIFDAFGKGDVATILAHCSDDTDWSFNTHESPVPWQRSYHGKAQLPSFFQSMAENMDIRAFEPQLIAEGSRDAVFRVRIGYTIRRNSKSVTEDQIQWWVLDEAGKVRALRHYTDTASVNAAFRA